MPVLIAEKAHATYARLLADHAPEVQVLSSGDPAELQRMAVDADIWLGQPDLLANLLRSGALPSWMQSTWAGITPLLRDGLPRSYRLTRAVGVFGQVMAEYMLTYMLSHEREVLSRLLSQVERRWDERPGRSLEGRRVLIVGCGEIGQQVAQYLAPFGVILHGVANSARAQAPFAEVAGLDALPRLVAQADYVLNLLPDTPATQDIFDAALLRQFNPEALLINAGRGAAIVDADLVEALRQGHLAGAVIDVCRQEPLPPKHPFWTAWGLLLTGHSAAPTSPPALVRLFVENLRAYQNGEPLRGEVDFQRGY
ncbi:D-2-hydroxyacid dehydrogenase [Pseudomonas cremoricolorata]|uniref:2-hydroxyacid dehydrogenase n=1 Tax=Pseudomonas cremoricolorata TaxID=157783 RepID=A0A089WKZ9_9PSED|nr:D-2-hydroxyacid dehydrogenase [Pseudomonas cremoricolorata]AIR89985.1 2-hydroxyacid dehydrogenase [Pseudomonas cremoricolorata]